MKDPHLLLSVLPAMAPAGAITFPNPGPTFHFVENGD